MDHIYYIDRSTGRVEEEKIFGGGMLRLFYGSSFMSKIFSPFWRNVFCKNALLSKLVGFYQRMPWTKKNILPFIERFHVDRHEFIKDVDSFYSFNDFFIRELKPKARPITPDFDVAVLPADGRYLFFPRIDQAEGFLVKGKKFLLEEFLQDKKLAQKYAQGTLVLARLCPTDYHRYHFPCDGVPGEPKLISGHLHSVNPLALRKRIEIFSENKRSLTRISTEQFGTVLYVEVGAACVGSIHNTFQPGKKYSKGDEKGYFSFGGSSLALLFLPGAITIDQDLLAATAKGLEIKALMGQSMGAAI